MHTDTDRVEANGVECGGLLDAGRVEAFCNDLAEIRAQMDRVAGWLDEQDAKRGAQ